MKKCSKNLQKNFFKKFFGQKVFENIVLPSLKNEMGIFLQNFRQKPSVYAGLRGIDTPEKMQYNSPTVKC